MSAIFFKAPWGNTLTTVTAVTTLLLVGISLVGIFTGPREQLSWWLAMVGLPLLILVITLMFTVRGYVLSNGTLKVQRLLWTTDIPLQALQAADYRPYAMRRSWRLVGNGGLFSFTGKFRNRELGVYRAFVTDLEQTVVLTFPDRKIVLSPENPGEFVNRVLSRQTNV